MYWEIWYNQGMIPANAYIKCPDGTLATEPCATELADRGILFENRILGLPRLRQVTNLSRLTSQLISGSNRLLIRIFDPNLKPDFNSS